MAVDCCGSRLLSLLILLEDDLAHRCLVWGLGLQVAWGKECTDSNKESNRDSYKSGDVDPAIAATPGHHQ